VMFFRNRRFFVKLRGRTVGLLILSVEPKVLRISSLAVDPEVRRLGIASWILDCAERMAKGLGEEYLELSVLKKNFAARSLYKNYGFPLKEERKRTLILAKRVQQD